jgi:creatinine amidohydrolase
MRWELLTSPQIGRAAQDPGLCVLTLGVLERHSDHLPLGTDYLTAHHIACLAAEREPAVIFPPFYFGQIYEARCFPGAVTLKPTLLLELLQGVLDEIGRNGFGKIVISNWHGGNNALDGFLVQCALWEQKPYTLYLAPWGLSGERAARGSQLLPPGSTGHACAMETSLMMAIAPEAVDAAAMPDHAAPPLGRLSHLGRGSTAVSWYANYPEHYAGDARLATPEIGRELTELHAAELAAFIAAVKADTVALALQAEFFQRERGIRE